MSSNHPVLETSPVFAKRIGVGVKLVRKWAREEGLPHLEIDRCIRIDVQAALEWLRARTKGSSK